MNVKQKASGFYLNKKPLPAFEFPLLRPPHSLCYGTHPVLVTTLFSGYHQDAVSAPGSLGGHWCPSCCPQHRSKAAREEWKGHPVQTQPSWQGKDLPRICHVVKRPDTEARHRSVCGAVGGLSALSEENPSIDFYIHVQKYILCLLFCI